MVDALIAPRRSTRPSRSVVSLRRLLFGSTDMTIENFHGFWQTALFSCVLKRLVHKTIGNGHRGANNVHEGITVHSHDEAAFVRELMPVPDSELQRPVHLKPLCSAFHEKSFSMFSWRGDVFLPAIQLRTEPDTVPFLSKTFV